MTDEWNIITRTIVPLIDQQDIPLEGMGESGLGDIVASQFLSPKAPTARGWIWGVGLVELLPSASDEMLGGEKWGLGPTGVVLKQNVMKTPPIFAVVFFNCCGIFCTCFGG